MSTQDTPHHQPDGSAAEPPAQQPVQDHGQEPAHTPSVPAHPVEQQTEQLPRPVHHQAAPHPTGGYPGAYTGPQPVTAHEPSTGQRQRSTWVPVTSAAVIAALLASGATAALTGAFGDGVSPSLSDVGTTQQSAVAPVSGSTNQNPDWQAVTAAVAPSVVAIEVAGARGGSQGSGVIYDAEGHIVTNDHVVSGATDGTVQVTLSDGRIYAADVVGTDPTTDLAVVRLTDAPDDLQPATVGDSGAVSVGDSVLAVGNPLGLAHTATTGIVSALDRPVSASGEGGGNVVVTNAIQIDAAINPGNSGGPLFDAQGRVIGITSSIASMPTGMGGSSGSIGLGFAIPANLASSVADQLIADGTVEHAFLGVSLRDATATADDVTRRGAEVMELPAGSPAAEAGLQVGDVVVAIDGEPVSGAESLTGAVRERSAGDQAAITYVRDGQTQTVEVTLAVREEPAAAPGPGGQQEQPPGDEEQGQQGEGGDSTQPDNIPGWLQDLLDGLRG